MAADEVLVIVTPGISPNNYNTAHMCTNGDAFVITPPVQGCSIQFNSPVLSTSPTVVPSENGVYSLPSNLVVSFFLQHLGSGYKDVQFYVGPAGVTATAGAIPDPGLNSAAHTVRVGSTGVGGSGGK